MQKNSELLELNKSIYEQMSFIYSAFLSLNLSVLITNFVLGAMLIASFILLINSTFPINMLFLFVFFIVGFMSQESLVFYITFRKKYLSKIKEYVKIMNNYGDLFAFFHDISFNLNAFNVNEKLLNDIEKSSYNDLFEKLEKEQYIDNLKSFIDIATNFKNDEEIKIYFERLTAYSIITYAFTNLIDLYTKLLNQYENYTRENTAENSV